MKCNDMPKNLVSLLYGELDPDEGKRIRAHIKTCPSCRRVYKELQSTSKLLQKWEDVTPDMNFVFVHESLSRWKDWKEKLTQLSWGRRLAFGIPVFAAGLLVFLAVLNFRVSYHEGEWNVTFSLIPKSQQPNQEQLFVEAIEQEQNETLLLISKIIEESENRQRRENALTLARFAQDQERQRQQELTMVGQSLEGFHRTTEAKFLQTSDVINDLIRLTSYKLERK